MAWSPSIQLLPETLEIMMLLNKVTPRREEEYLFISVSRLLLVDRSRDSTCPMTKLATIS